MNLVLLALAATGPRTVQIRYDGQPGVALSVVVEIPRVGTFWDGVGFSGSPLPLAVSESTALRGRYALDIDTSAWPDERYIVRPVLTTTPPTLDGRFVPMAFTLAS